MPIIVLTHPFLHHYAGSIFELSDTIGDSGWDEDDRVRDRQPCYDKRVYSLPDNGKGVSIELPVEYTRLCPPKILNEIDLKSGPCRITSVSEGLEKQQNDPWFADPLPMGRGKLLLKNSGTYTKNVIETDGSINPISTKTIIINLISEDSKIITEGFHYEFQLDLSNFHPGFYKVELRNDTSTQHFFTVIKCFPLVVTCAEYSDKYTTARTLW